MDNPFTEVQAAVNQARRLDEALSNWTPNMARLIVGRLRNCNHSELVALKRELADFNIQTGRWKARK